MTTDMFIMDVFFAIGWGIGGILLVFSLYELYQQWKNNDNKK